MNNITDAALDHAAMAEQLLSNADDAITRGALGEINPEVAAMMADRYIAAAHVHATLATVPQPLEAAVGFSSVVDLAGVNWDGPPDAPLPPQFDLERDTLNGWSGIRVGSRVVLVDRNTRQFPVITNDTLGTVVHAWHSEEGGRIDRAKVEWDDGIPDTEHALAELAVVLGA